MSRTFAQEIKNVLIIYADDQSYHTIHAQGNKEIYTPNLDALAQQGLSFRQAHVMGGHQGAVCMPSRVMMLSGRYINRLPGDGNVIPDSIVGLPEVLRHAGYTTFQCGKWHSDKASYNRFFNTGAHIFFGGMHTVADGGQFHPKVFDYDPTGIYPSENRRQSDTYSSELYADAAVEFLQSDVAKKAPFLCYVAFTSPHDPRTPPSAFAGLHKAEQITLPPNFLPQHPFDNGDMRVRDELLLPSPRTPDAIKNEIALYYDMISEMDFQVGRIVEALEKNGLKENTPIVFAADNGLAVGQHGLLGKQNLYEHSIRVPMIFVGPGIPANRQSNAFVYLSDIAPTLYDLLRIQAPGSVEAKSLLPVIRDQHDKVRNQIYNVYGHWSRSIKTDDGFKLIVYNVDGKERAQLFNLKNDPWETKDLAVDVQYRQQIELMRKALKAEMSAAHDDLDIDLPDWGRKPNQRPYGS
jgi:arylsulfatase A-like enzyme